MSSLMLMLVLMFVAISLIAWYAMAGTARAATTYRETFTANAQENLSKMFVFVDSRKVFHVNLIGIVVLPIVIYAVTSNVVLTFLAGVAAFAVPKWAYKYMAAKRLEAIDLGLPDALAQIAGAMRAGSAFAIAVENMVRETKGPISQEFGMVLKEQRVGVALEDAMQNLGRRVGSENVDLVVAASLVAKDVGGNLAEIFERLSVTLREKIAMEGKIKALTAQGKLQGWVVGLLPMGMILVLSQMESSAISALTNSLAGWIWLSAIIVLELMGLWMIRKIVSIDV